MVARLLLRDPASSRPGYDGATPERGDGIYTETVLLPFRVDRYIPPVVRGDTVWAVATDEIDIQYVVRARLRPSVDRVTR